MVWAFLKQLQHLDTGYISEINTDCFIEITAVPPATAVDTDEDVEDDNAPTSMELSGVGSFLKQLQHTNPQPGDTTVCPRSSDPFYKVSYYMKWVTTS